MKKKRISLQYLGWGTFLSGALALVGIYLGAMVPLGFYALIIPTILATLRWRWPGGRIAVGVSMLCILPAVIADVRLWPDALFASALIVGAAWMVRGEYRRRVLTLETPGKIPAQAASDAAPMQASDDQVQEMATLQAMGRRLGENLELETTLNVVLTALSELVPYDVGEITLFDKQREVLISRAQFTNRPEWEEIDLRETAYTLDEGLSGWLARARRPLRIADIHEFEAVRPKNDTLGPGLCSFLGVPLLSRGELVGTLEIAAKDAGRFSAPDQRLAELFAGQAATAIENARLYESSQNRVEMLERLRQIVRAVGRAGDPDAFFAEVVKRVAELTAAEAAGVLVYDAEQSAMVAPAPFLGLPESWRARLSVPYPGQPDGPRWDQKWGERFYWLVEDAQEDATIAALGMDELVQACDLHQVLVVALETGGERVGFIIVANPQQKQSFTSEDAHLLAMLASQISGMVHSSQLVAQMQQRTQQLRSLVSVASTMGASLDLDAVLNTIVATVSRILDCQRTAIFVLDPEQGTLGLAAAEGVSERYREESRALPVVRGGRGHVVAVNEMYVSSDVQQEPESSGVAPMAAVEGFRAFADLPLRRGNQPLGMLSVQFTDPHPFTDDELNLLRILAEQAAIAIENARLYTQTDVELHRRLEALESLQRVTQEITSTVDLDYILQVVLDEAVQFGDADAGFVVVWENTTPRLRASQGYDTPALDQVLEIIQDPAPDALFSRFEERQETVYLPDVQTREDADSFPAPTRSVLAVPVFYERRMAAAIVLRSNQPHAFPPVVLEFVEGLSTQTAIAVGNARNFQDQVRRGELMRQRAEQMSLLLEASRTMRSDRPLEDTLLDVAYAVQEGCGFDIVLISVLEEDRLRRVAGAGIPLAELERMKTVRQPWPAVKALFQPEFQLGRSYYIPAEQSHLIDDLDTFVPEDVAATDLNGMWHKLDAFVVPLIGSRGEIVGIMSLDKPRNGMAPTARVAEVAEIFAGQVALAIENHRLVQDLRRQVATLRLFNELNRSITTKLDLSLVLDTVVESVTGVLEYDYATIFLRDESGKQFIPLAAGGYDVDDLEAVAFGKAGGLVGTVAQMGMPLVIDDTEAEPRFQPGPLAVGSCIMVPLQVEERTVGVLAADRQEKGDFSPTEVATLTALADQVSVAVENARLFDQVNRFSEELEVRVEERTQELAEALEDLRLQRDRSNVLYQIASELVSSLDIDRVLSQALALLQKAVRASKSSVLLLDEERTQLSYQAAIGEAEPIPPGGKLAPFSPQTGVVGWVLGHREPVVIADVLEDARWDPDLNGSVRSIIVVPIISSDDEPLGVIMLQSEKIGAFDEHGVRLVEAAAMQIRNALNNAELHRYIREQAERLGVMLRTQQIEAAKSQAILEGIADGVMMADANGRVTLFNAAAERIFSLPRAQALGRFQDEILGLYGSAARAWLAQIQAWKQNPESCGSDEFMAQQLEIEKRMVSVHLSPVVSPSQEFLGVVSVFRDITREVEAERAKNEFVSTVSHELRTPMTSIKGYVDLLLMGAVGSLEPQQENFLQKVQSNADRLTKLVNDLLDISRIETGRFELEREPLPMAGRIEEVLEMFLPKAQEKGLALRSVIPESLPKVQADRDRLTQILVNLVGNAYKYTPTGEICVYAYVRDAMMHVAVADTGIGIAPGNQRRIFERFFREESVLTEEVTGTGLGLAITVSLIQLHGGDIFLESESGEGSIFFFTMPLAAGEPTDDVGAAPDDWLTEKPRAFTVLVVEDDPDIGNLLCMTLGHEGFRVKLATSGEDAVRIARELMPDLITLDIRLPDINGFEVLHRLRSQSQTADIPVVVISVISDEARGMRFEAVDYLTKPIDEEKLLRVVKRTLKQTDDTILVVDESPETLQKLRLTLHSQGVRVRTASEGMRALKLAQSLHPALMVLGLRLPDMDGYQILEHLKRDPETSGIPVVVTAQHIAAPGRATQTTQATQWQVMEALQLLSQPLPAVELAARLSHLAYNGNGVSKE